VVNGGKAVPEGLPFKTVVADVLPDDGAVFLFNETVVVFLVVAGAGEGDGTGWVAEPVGDDLIDKLAAIIAVELPQGEGQARMDVLECIEGPAVGLVEQGIQAYPA
jgi:hypothetical protein